MPRSRASWTSASVLRRRLEAHAVQVHDVHGRARDRAGADDFQERFDRAPRLSRAERPHMNEHGRVILGGRAKHLQDFVASSGGVYCRPIPTPSAPAARPASTRCFMSAICASLAT